MATLLVWFILSRVFAVFGSLLNDKTPIKVWNVFGDAMGFFSCIIAVGLAAGIDTFQFL